MNLYAYVGNNPISFKDPHGLTQESDKRNEESDWYNNTPLTFHSLIFREELEEKVAEIKTDVAIIGVLENITAILFPKPDVLEIQDYFADIFTGDGITSMTTANLIVTDQMVSEHIYELENSKRSASSYEQRSFIGSDIKYWEKIQNNLDRKLRVLDPRHPG